MKPERLAQPETGLFEKVAAYGEAFRRQDRPVHPQASAAQLRKAFCSPLPETPMPVDDVIDALIAAAEPGLVGNTGPDFYAWVMGASDQAGVSADMLTSIWGQNAAIYQTSPAAAIAEEAVAAWLLDLFDLPRAASVGFVTGATMASFVGLAAARDDVLRRHGYDLAAHGLAGSPPIGVFLSDDAHVANFASLRYLGFGAANIHKVASDADGLMRIDGLRAAMNKVHGPKIIIGQAGHINSGGFENFRVLSSMARQHDAWLHIDAAFGLWARLLPEKSALTRGLELADSWSVDGHKWLQLPYDSGFAIVRDQRVHRRAMDLSAGYLNIADNDGRNPTSYNPELSRRARGFAAWATIKSLGRSGVQAMIRNHCQLAAMVAAQLQSLDGLEEISPPHLNQLIVRSSDRSGHSDHKLDKLAQKLNAQGSVFVRPANWQGRRVLRLSFIGGQLNQSRSMELAMRIRTCWCSIVGEHGPASI